MVYYQGMMFSNWSQACKKMGVRDSSFRYYTNKKGMPKADALTHLFLVASGIKKSKPSIVINHLEFSSKKEACEYYDVCRTVVCNIISKDNLPFELAIIKAVERKKRFNKRRKSIFTYRPLNIGIDYFLYKHPAVLNLL
ncbi:hypothetical protein OAO18_05715 [Francisellaceae bacterium]|nr:hypothetical protein [Francisellaceae bacterium]